MKVFLSIIYIYYNTPKEITESVRSIKQAVGSTRYEVLIIDNNSAQKIPSSVLQMPWVHVYHNKNNIGFGPAINLAVRKSKGEILLLINPDTLFFPHAISRLLKRLLSDPKIGIIGPKIINKKGELLESISKMPSFANSLVIFSFLRKLWPFSQVEKNYHLRSLNREKEQKVPVLSGACMMMRKSMFEKAGGFDEQFFMYFEEADLCYRVKKAAHVSNLYFPQAVITHFVGRSTSDKVWIKKTFQKSRFLFLKKYHGNVAAFLAEGFLRMLQSNGMLLAVILLTSSIVNFYRLSELMMFLGDYGRDFLAARDMLLTGKIPLLGITSSVVWLHQGPLSVYLIALSFFVGKFNPVAPAMLYAFLSVLTTFFVYLLGKNLFNTRVGLLSSAFYATSPLFVLNARIPYHTSPIPLVVSVVFLVLIKILKGNTSLAPLLFFLCGILVQFELSNAVIFISLAILFFAHRAKFSQKNKLFSFIAFLLGILPFLLYDISHRFVQTIGFLFWILHRIALFFGISPTGGSINTSTTLVLETIWQQLVSAIYPISQYVVVVLLSLFVLLLLRKIRVLLVQAGQSYFVLFLWLSVPLSGFIVHSAPGAAYFPLLFPAIALLVGVAWETLVRKSRIFLLLFLFFVVSNAFFIFTNAFFMIDSSRINHASFSNNGDWRFGFGIPLYEREIVVSEIVKDAKRQQIRLEGGGYLSDFPSYIDNYKYLVWYKGGHVFQKSTLVYKIYEQTDKLDRDETVFFKTNLITVTKKMSK